jgi:hypothetical protein
MFAPKFQSVAPDSKPEFGMATGVGAGAEALWTIEPAGYWVDGCQIGDAIIAPDYRAGSGQQHQGEG